MKKKVFLILFISGTVLFSSCSGGKQVSVPEKIVLKEHWAIQSSAKVKAGGDKISTAAYQPAGWYPATMPSTVLAALVKDGVYPDPYYGTRIDSLPGYKRGNMVIMPKDSPYRVPWWYRTVVDIPESYRDKQIWLDFHSINYKANIWLNGHLVADTIAVEGAYRRYDFNVTEYAVPGGKNYLALEIFPPGEMALTITWVDWNPTPPDRAMGIWYGASMYATGTVSIKHPHVITELNLPATDTARLTIAADLKNTGKKSVTGTLTGRIENREFSQKVTLAPGETRTVTFTPDRFPQMTVPHPRLWWPHTVGPQNLYDLKLAFTAHGKVLDRRTQRFGIRQITYRMNHFDGNKVTRVFQINGKNIVIRGGGYVEDMMLRTSKRDIDVALRYAKHMNLNALRMEAPRGPDYLFDRCDEEGILLMVGWCCCSTWEQWPRWDKHTADIAEESWKDLILRLRNHPSVFTWLYGSDRFPPPQVEKRYIAVLNKYDGTRPYESSATGDSSAIAGRTGFWMGPYPDVYAYFTPTQWYAKEEFNTECSPGGEQIPPVESMRKMMPEEDLWPISESWNIRLYKMFYPQARKALYSRYGQPESLKEYSMKSQVFQKEATRAMFEAFARNKYRSSGVIYWMYNSAWPSLYWQLYDYYLTPNGAFYGTKKACEPLHIQYSYDDGTIYVVNGYYRDFQNLKASVQIYDFNMNRKFSREVPVNIASDESQRIMYLRQPDQSGPVWFVKLALKSDQDSLISSNFYWLSAKGDEKADFTALDRLPRVKLKAAILSFDKKDNRDVLVVSLENPSASLAFDINPSVKKDSSGDLVTPVFWEDNYFSLLPGEKRTVKVEFDPADLDGEKPVLHVEGWNVRPVDMAAGQ